VRLYAHMKPYFTLAPFTGYSECRFTDLEKATDQERKTFGSSMIAVLRKKNKKIISLQDARARSNSIIPINRLAFR
jgi:hypothetical protein